MRDAVFTTLSAVGSYFLAIGGFQLLERVIPAERSQPWRNLLFSATCTLGLLLLNPLVAAATIWSAGFLRPSLISIDLRTLTLGFPPIDWLLSNFLVPLIPIFIFDFFYYWHHRFQHTIPAFWEQHKLHHAEESLNCLTNLRHHWLEDFIRIVTISLPIGLLVHITPIQGALILVAVTHWSIFFHANLRLPFGPFTPVITGPQYHRIHHSCLSKHQNRNFAAFFPIWDVLFLTYYRPQTGEWPPTGLHSGGKIGVADAVIGPFKAWSRMIRPDLTKAEWLGLYQKWVAHYTARLRAHVAAVEALPARWFGAVGGRPAALGDRDCDRQPGSAASSAAGQRGDVGLGGHSFARRPLLQDSKTARRH